MWRTARFIIPGSLLIALCLPAAMGQTTPPLEQQLQKDYKIVKLGSDSNGTTVLEAGTVLAIQRGGLLGVPEKSMAVCPAKYEDGNLKAPSTICRMAVKKDSRYFNVGDKVYPSKIEVNYKDDRVQFSVVYCDCNQAQQGQNLPWFYKSQIMFQFPKGSLANTDAAKVKDMIAQVFTVDTSGNANNNGNNNNGNNNGGGNGNNGGDQQGQGQGNGQGNQGQQQGDQGQQQQPDQPPPTIQMGESIDDVVNALGQPTKIVNLGHKQIYVYKDLKITFTNGKVTDVQ